MNRKKILVTGAAGAVGREVIAELARASGHLEIRALDLPGRTSHRILKPYRNRIEFIPGSIEDSETVARAVKGVDIVIHLAAIIPPLADENPDLAGRVNVWGTHNVINAIKHHAPDAFLLYSSSVSVYGDRLKNPWISVGDELKPSEGDLYAGTKITAEQMIRKSGLKYSIFRFTGIMSPDQINRGSMDPTLFHMPLDTSLEMATTRDCGFALARSIYHMNSLQGRIFNLGGGEACRIKYRELLRRTFDILGVEFSRLDEHAFATRNFHCGFYRDSDELEQILHFQRDSVETFLQWIQESLPIGKRLLVHLSRRRAIRFLMKQSEPLNAIRSGNEILINRFFGRQPSISTSS